MGSKLAKGAAAGAIAGVIIGVLAWIFFRTGLLSVNPLVVSADIVLPKTTAVTPFGLVLGAGVHLLLSVLFGAVFAVLVPDFGSKVLWGLGYGLVLELANSGVIGPLLGALPPITQVGLSTIITGTVSRLVYGALLGYIVGLLTVEKKRSWN